MTAEDPWADPFSPPKCWTRSRSASSGFVARRKEGLYVHFSLADEDVFRLCDIVCGRLAAEAVARGRMPQPA